jgi:serine/threonine-protein kinase
MVLRDGTLKLTDFGIAKDLDSTQLTSANCTVGTAAYMSPEQCKGERDITHKSDLYSLGVMFYELVTGRKPFTADNAMEMFLQHVQGTFERPSRLVLDLPVWFDTLICQMLEKKPEQRPMDAATVGNVLAQIQEKVEAQQSAGVDVVRARRIDLTRDRRRTDEEDREAARTLMAAATGKRRRKRKQKPIYRRLWFQGAGIGLGLAVVAVLLWLVFRPPSQEKLYQGAARAMEQDTDQDEVREAARDRIKEYLKYYGRTPGEQTTKARQWLDDLEVKDFEWKLKRHQEKPTLFKPQGDLEGRAFEAADDEAAGELEGAKQKWQKVAEQEGAAGWGLLARKHVEDIAAVPLLEGRLATLWKEFFNHGREPQLEGPQRLAFTAVRAESFGDPFLAKQRFEELKKDCFGKADLHVWYVFAARKVKELEAFITRDFTDEQKKDPEKYRRELVQNVLDQVTAGGLNQKSRRLCAEVLAVYSDDPKLKPLVEQAGKVLEGPGKKPSPAKP